MKLFLSVLILLSLASDDLFLSADNRLQTTGLGCLAPRNALNNIGRISTAMPDIDDERNDTLNCC
ncbi:MAG: hypothetical protein JW774_07680 [Candidatus Aureabacteria bacterium]|nr:hypothetical protein [Candidatus Auribacterota bacterium]